MKIHSIPRAIFTSILNQTSRNQQNDEPNRTSPNCSEHTTIARQILPKQLSDKRAIFPRACALYETSIVIELVNKRENLRGGQRRMRKKNNKRRQR